MVFFIIGMTLCMTVLIGVMLVTRGMGSDRASMKVRIYRPQSRYNTQPLPVVKREEDPRITRLKKKLSGRLSQNFPLESWLL